MRAVIISDNSKVAGALQTQLQTHGFDCRLDRDVLPLSAATSGAAKKVGQDLLVVVMPLDFQSGLRAVRKLRASTRGTIVVVGPTDNSKSLLTVLREGANEYLDINELSSELTSTLARLQLHRSRDLPSGRVISLIGACGGSGTSCLATNLAAVFARNKQCGLIDLRLGLGDLSLLLDLEPKHSLATICRNTSRLDQSMFRHSLLSHSSGIQLLAAPNAWDECAQVTAKGVRHAITLSRTQFPHVVVDLDNTFTAEQVAGIVSSDVVLVVIRPDMLSLKNGRRIIDTLDRLGVSEHRIHTVINRNGQRGQLPVSRVKHAIGGSMLQTLPEDQKSMNMASNKGVPIVIEMPRNRISRQIANLATVLEKLPGVYDQHRNIGANSTVPQASRAKANGTNLTAASVPNGNDNPNKNPEPKGNGANELDTTSIEFSV